MGTNKAEEMAIKELENIYPHCFMDGKLFQRPTIIEDYISKFTDGYNSRQSEIDELTKERDAFKLGLEDLTKIYINVSNEFQRANEYLTKEVERLRKESEFKSTQLGQIHDIVDKQNFDTDSREFEIWQIINQEPPINH